MTDLPAVPQEKGRGHDLVVTGKVTAAAAAVEVLLMERKVELLENTAPNSVVDVVVVLAEEVVALEVVRLVLLLNRDSY